MLVVETYFFRTPDYPAFFIYEHQDYSGFVHLAGHAEFASLSFNPVHPIQGWHIGLPIYRLDRYIGTF